jgi:glycosyltransferase involved in cell wall biosynthesis
MKRRLLFHRDFRMYTGGHGKVWDYYRHAGAHPGWEPQVYFTAESINAGNPWRAAGTGRLGEWRPHAGNTLFLAGMDWQAWPDDDPAIPVLNLIQHVRHADPQQPLRAFLHRRAIRICVSQPVADAILDTGEVRGPVHVIEAALDLPAHPDLCTKSGIVIGAIKHPVLGVALASALDALGLPVRLLDQWVPRSDYLDALAAAEVAVLLPHPTEGFYLPALEAMALRCAVVVPDCVGNRAYLQPGRNALVPESYQLEDLVECVVQLQEAGLRHRLQAAGPETSGRFTLARERAAFHALLDDLQAAWSSA